MRSSQQLEAPPFASLRQSAGGHRRIALPLHSVLGFARQDSESRPSRQLAFALRPLLGLALATTGLCPDPPAAPSRRSGRTGGDGAGDPETLISALSSLVEVVKLLTPSEGKVYARLGHEALSSQDGAAGRERYERREHGSVAAAPRSQVVIELVSTASCDFARLPPQILDDIGSLAFELAVVAAIVESKGGELYLGAPQGGSRSFVVRLPVCRVEAAVKITSQAAD
ncbi:MAG: hypothetical protein JOZ15_13560 [Acidobacteria bacterium]|nr:hypothetical protein [Acidobacteriota bacterium]